MTSTARALEETGLPAGSGTGPADRIDTLAPTCGNGVIDPGELCDYGIPYGMPGACPSIWGDGCPRQKLCVDRVIKGTDCQAQCVDQPITASSPKPDMCCAAPGDPDCPVAYPLQLKKDASASDSFGTCARATKWLGTVMSLYVPLAPTCGTPAVMTFSTTNPGVSPYSPGKLNFQASTPNASYPQGTGSYYLNGGGIRQQSFAIPVVGDPTFLAMTWEPHSCTGTSYTTTANLDIRPLQASTVVASGSKPHVAGDHVGQYVLYEDAGAIKVVAGQISPTYYGTWDVLKPQAWTQSGSIATVATAGIEPALAIQSVSPATAYTQWPTAHVVYVNPLRTELRYAAVDSKGTLSNAQTLRTGTGIARPQLIRWDGTQLGVAWLENGGGHSQLKVARVLLSSGALAGAVTEVTSGTSEALEPALAANSTAGTMQAAVAWISSGAKRQLFIQRLDANAAVVGAAELVSAATVGPAEPALQAIYPLYPLFRVVWTDSRDGGRSIYVKDNVTSPLGAVPFSTRPDFRVSPLGVDAHGARLAGHANRSELGTPDTDQARILWMSGDTGNTVRYSEVRSLSNAYTSFTLPLPLTCASASASPDQFLVWGVGQPGIALPYPILSALQYGVWVEDGRVVIQPLNLIIIPRQPR